jgi:hypothetical protein
VLESLYRTSPRDTHLKAVGSHRKRPTYAVVLSALVHCNALSASEILDFGS